jgi:hypothetical protein
MRKIDDHDGQLARRYADEHRAKYGANDPRTRDAMNMLARHMAQDDGSSEGKERAKLMPPVTYRAPQPSTEPAHSARGGSNP